MKNNKSVCIIMKITTDRKFNILEVKFEKSDKKLDYGPLSESLAKEFIKTNQVETTVEEVVNNA